MIKIRELFFTAVFTAVTAVSAAAADKTVSLSVSDTYAGAGNDYTVYVSLDKVPDAGISSMDFAISYDSNNVTVDSADSLMTGTVGSDDELFDWYDTGSGINICRTTLGDNYVTTPGNIIALSGKVLSTAAPGTKAKFEIVPVSRTVNPESSELNTQISVGIDTDSGFDAYEVSANAGYVTVAAKGDVNVDGVVDGKDAAIVLKHIMKDEAIESPYSAWAADCAAEIGVLDIKDVIRILSNVSYGGTALDISTTSINQCTYSNGVLNAKDVAMFGIALTKSLNASDSVKIYMRAKDNGGTGFRCWLSDASGDSMSDGSISSDVLYPDANGETLVFTRTAAQAVDRILVKGPSWDTNIADLDIEYVGVEYLSGSVSEETTETTTQSRSSVSGHSHSFTAGLTDSFFTITGDLSSEKGSVTYNNETITQCLKLSSKASIEFTAGNAGKLTLVFNESSDSRSVYLDNTSYDIPSNGILTVDFAAGSHTVKKHNTESYLYYMSVS